MSATLPFGNPDWQSGGVGSKKLTTQRLQNISFAGKHKINNKNARTNQSRCKHNSFNSSARDSTPPFSTFSFTRVAFIQTAMHSLIRELKSSLHCEKLQNSQIRRHHSWSLKGVLLNDVPFKDLKKFVILYHLWKSLLVRFNAFVSNVVWVLIPQQEHVSVSEFLVKKVFSFFFYFLFFTRDRM